MKQTKLISVLLGFLFLSGCAKETALHIRFEVSTTAPVAREVPTIVTNIGESNSVTHKDFTSGTNWSKTVVEKTRSRPIDISLYAGNVILSSSGYVISRIIINNKEVSISTVGTTLTGDKFIAKTIAVNHHIES